MPKGIVIGAGISGLLAAKAISNAGWEVVVLDKDSLPDSPSPRKGTQQAVHAHMLLQAGLEAIEALYPGFQSELVSRGAVMANMTRDWHTMLQEGTLVRGDSTLDFISASRLLIEYILREQLVQNPRLTLKDGSRITNVELRSESPPIVHYSQDGKMRSIRDADLVIDASGRSSRCLQWLEAGGYEKVPVSTTTTRLGYASCLYHNLRLPRSDLGWSCMYRAPNSPCAGIIMPIENQQYLVTLSGLCDNNPPGEAQGFLDFASSLRCAGFKEILETGEPISDIKTFRKPDNYYRGFHRLKHWPSGFIVTGDGVCSFNPVYGQGMTAAAVAARSLAPVLARHHPSDAKTLQKKINQAYRMPWLIARTEDQRWTEAQPLASRLAHRLMDRLNRAGMKDMRIAATYLSVLHMKKSPLALLRPYALVKALTTHLPSSSPNRSSR